MSKLIPVEFHGDVLWAQEVEGVVYVALKPVCESLSIDWEGQRQRIERDPVLVEGACMIKAPSRGGEQDTLCLPLPLLNGWLFGIDAGRIKDPDIRERIIAYKRECYDVLHRHFHRKPEPMPDPGLSPDLPPTDARQWIDAIALALRVHGRGAARRLWAQSPLPQVGGPDLAEPPTPDGGPDLDGHGCLDHLLAWDPFGTGHALSHWLKQQPTPKLKSRLAAHGILLRPKRFKDSFGVANRNDELARMFRRSEWAEEWTAALMQVPGVYKSPIPGWFGKTSSRYLVVPLDLADAPEAHR